MVFNALGPDNEFRKDAMAKGLSVLERINKQCLVTLKALQKRYTGIRQIYPRKIILLVC